MHSVFRHCCHLLWRRTCSGEEHHWRGGWVAIMIYLKMVVELEAWPINYVFLSLHLISKNNFSHRQVWASHTRWCNSRRKGKTKTHKEKQKMFFENLRIPIKAGSISHQPHADGEHNQRHHRLHQVLCQHQHHQWRHCLHQVLAFCISSRSFNLNVCCHRKKTFDKGEEGIWSPFVGQPVHPLPPCRAPHWCRDAEVRFNVSG